LVGSIFSSRSFSSSNQFNSQPGSHRKPFQIQTDISNLKLRFPIFFFPLSVTRLGEFSPLSRLLTLANYVKSTELALILVPLFRKVMYLIWNKMFLGYIVGVFFSNSSGHPVSSPKNAIPLMPCRGETKTCLQL
jgi:hypothetical protein